jgi:hypothetical protein
MARDASDVQILCVKSIDRTSTSTCKTVWIWFYQFSEGVLFLQSDVAGQAVQFRFVDTSETSKMAWGTGAKIIKMLNCTDTSLIDRVQDPNFFDGTLFTFCQELTLLWHCISGAFADTESFLIQEGTLFAK